MEQDYGVFSKVRLLLASCMVRLLRLSLCVFYVFYVFYIVPLRCVFYSAPSTSFMRLLRLLRLLRVLRCAFYTRVVLSAVCWRMVWPSAWSSVWMGSITCEGWDYRSLVHQYTNTLLILMRSETQYTNNRLKCHPKQEGSGYTLGPIGRPSLCCSYS